MFPLGPDRKSEIVLDRVSFHKAEIGEEHMTVTFGSAVPCVDVTSFSPSSG